MALRNIIKGEDPILRKKSREVTSFDDRLHTLLDDMKETMEEADGVGLAAVQVGVLRCVVIINVNDEHGHLEFINPELLEVSEEQIERYEGCLSFPGETSYVPRPATATVKAQDRHGEWFTITGEAMLARAICHETDHLNGTIFHDLAIEAPEDEEPDDYYGENCEETEDMVEIEANVLK